MLTRRTLLKGTGAATLAIPFINRPSTARENHPAACKVLASRWTGSGLFCGFDFDENGVLGGIISTNAHVAPQLGERYNCQFMLPSGIARSYTGTAKFVVYSRTKPYDFAFLHVPAITPDTFATKPVSMSKEKLVLGQNVFTTGSPRGVWPLATVENQFTRWLAEGINGFSPNNAIGGQSGSGIQRELSVDEPKPKPYSPNWSFDPGSVDECKLAWTWNGLMAGMDTNLIWGLVSADDRRAEMRASPDRPPGLIEVTNNFWQDRGLKEGIFEVAPNPDVLTFAGLPANVWDASKLKIWYRPDDGPIEPPPEPGDLTDDEIKVCVALKAHYDLVKLSELLLSVTARDVDDELSTNAPDPLKVVTGGMVFEPNYAVKPANGFVVGESYPGTYNGKSVYRRLSKVCDLTGNCTFPWIDP